MNALAIRVRTFAAIGLANGLRAVIYRLALRLGLHPVQRITAQIVPGNAFAQTDVATATGLTAPAHWRDEGVMFGHHRVPLAGECPQWTRDPLAGSDAAPGAGDEMPAWWQIGDFAAGDIKHIWEFSRFDWAMAFAQQVRAGDQKALDRLNCWISDWGQANPPYRGPNWKCAQEASIRLIHLAVAARLLGQTGSLSPSLRSLIDVHVLRIRPTLSYAHAQDNNHATSEAAALFVTGVWLKLSGEPDEALLTLGRRLLEKHVIRLFSTDGSFSQYSLNYHRLALDTLCVAEIWRRAAGLPSFSPTFRARAAAATGWLRAMVDPETGDAPNLGANDGANLLPLTDLPYRDYRPTVQLAMALFEGRRAYPPGPWDGSCAWLGVSLPEALAEKPGARVFDEGGYAILREGRAMAMLRYPRFGFRPGHADALHLDLWVGGKNLLRDGGSFSYNSGDEWTAYFGGVESHNTVQFDGQPQMPRLSRFLLGDWLKTHDRGPVAKGFFACYRQRAGWSHRRQVVLAEGLRVVDRLSGFRREAKVRWRLAPGDWRIEGDCATDGRHRLRISANVPLVGLRLTQGWESRHYAERTPLPVLEVMIDRPGEIVSEYEWAS